MASPVEPRAATHSAGCWRRHVDCAVRRVEALEGEVERLTDWRPQSAVGATQLREMTERATRYAKALVKVAHDDGSTYDPGECKPDRYVACEAALWLAEQEQQ